MDKLYNYKIFLHSGRTFLWRDSPHSTVEEFVANMIKTNTEGWITSTGDEETIVNVNAIELVKKEQY